MNAEEAYLISSAVVAVKKQEHNKKELLLDNNKLKALEMLKVAVDDELKNIYFYIQSNAKSGYYSVSYHLDLFGICIKDLELREHERDIIVHKFDNDVYDALKKQGYKVEFHSNNNWVIRWDCPQ